MNTKLVMSASAILMGVTGVALSFMPHEINTYIAGAEGSDLDAIIFQILGALYFAFAMTNWTARANLIGGIYARPIAIGNLCHFVIGALALAKVLFRSQHTLFWVPTIIYVLLAIAFAWIFFTHPVKSK